MPAAFPPSDGAARDALPLSAGTCVQKAGPGRVILPVCQGGSSGDPNPYGLDTSHNCSGWNAITAGMNGPRGANSDGDAGGFHQPRRDQRQRAREQDKFWEMRGVLFANARQLEEENLAKYAETIGLDQSEFEKCLASDRYLAAIDQSASDAGKVQVIGTPTFVVGRAAGDWVEGRRVVGARDYKVFEVEILNLIDEGSVAGQ
jgi:hypothetical protein